MKQRELIIGIDEAGRGPLAGPVYVGLVLAPADFDFGIFANLNDSKQMTEQQRVKIIEKLKNSSDLPIQTKVSFTEAATIDKIGIVPAIQQAINRGLKRLDVDHESSYIYLDGSLKAPQTFPQETIIGGDGLVPIISLASVVAKVARDRYMERVGERYLEYGFAQHKGYGTKAHRDAIKQHGPSSLHRKSFLSNLI